MSERRKWTRDEEIIVLKLYCEIPFKNSSKSHPKVIEVAKLINRSPSSVNMKIGNLGSFDSNLRKKGIVGLSNASKLDEEIWHEFNNNWNKLTYESEQIIKKLGNTVDEHDIIIPPGRECMTTVKQRATKTFLEIQSYHLTIIAVA